MSEKIHSMQEDLKELRRLLESASRKQVQEFLSSEINKVQNEINSLQAQCESTESQPAKRRPFNVKITQYAWNETSPAIELFLNIPNVHTVPPENIVCTFSTYSVEFYAKEVDGKDYYFTLNKLLHSINPKKSSWKVKTDKVIIYMAKECSEQWKYLTTTEKDTKEKELKKKKVVGDDDEEEEEDASSSSNPTANLMKMMQRLYEDGDDEMKRTIAKAWYESREKGGQMPPL